MKIFLDTEFLECDDTRLKPISVGLVREDGKEFYTQITGVTELQFEQNTWFKTNVGRHLQFALGSLIGPIPKLGALQIEYFCGEAPEFWADYAAYDWVVICQLFGNMVALPKSWPMFCRDFQQLLDYVALDFGGLDINPKHGDNDCGNREFLRRIGPEQDPATLHHALHDARHLKAQYDFIQSHL